MENIYDYVTVSNIVSNKDCDIIVNKTVDNKLWKSHEWSSTYPNEELYSHNTNEPDSQFATEEIQKILNNSISEALHKYPFNDKIVNKFTTPRLNRYKINHKMRSHIDHIYGIFDGIEKGIPVLTVVGVLNNDYEGGDFIINNKVYSLNKGDILIFPSLFIYKHKVNIVTKGVRHSFVSWAY